MKKIFIILVLLFLYSCGGSEENITNTGSIATSSVTGDILDTTNNEKVKIVDGNNIETGTTEKRNTSTGKIENNNTGSLNEEKILDDFSSDIDEIMDLLEIKTN